jgi:hypothetical protein
VAIRLHVNIANYDHRLCRFSVARLCANYFRSFTSTFTLTESIYCSFGNANPNVIPPFAYTQTE